LHTKLNTFCVGIFLGTEYFDNISVISYMKYENGRLTGLVTLHRNCLLKEVIEGKIKGEMEVTRRRGRRRKKILDDLKDRRGYAHLKEEALDRTVWRNRFGRGFGPVIQAEYCMNECDTQTCLTLCSQATTKVVFFLLPGSIPGRDVRRFLMCRFVNAFVSKCNLLIYRVKM
jgi:hypothetical protein